MSLLIGVCALAASCESTTQVGSECPDGRCSSANAVTLRSCLLSSVALRVTVADDGQSTGPGLQSLCVGRSLPLDEDGNVACRVRWRFGTGAAGQAAPVPCGELPFLEPDEGAEPGACLVAQRSADEAAAAEDGWYYDSSVEDCVDGGPGVRFTQAATPPAGVTVDLVCSVVQAETADGELQDVDSAECEPTVAKGDDLGAACVPALIPSGGFDSREAWVHVRSNQCDTEACLVFGLAGDPSPACVDGAGPTPCPGQDEVARHSFCSCRCDAPAGDPGPLCECGDGFSCVPTLEDGPAGIRGSYCVRDEILP